MYKLKDSNLNFKNESMTKEASKYCFKLENYKTLLESHYSNQKTKLNKICDDILKNLKIFQENTLLKINEEFENNMKTVSSNLKKINKYKSKFNYFDEFDENNKIKTLSKFNNFIKNADFWDLEVISINIKAKNNKIDENSDFIKNLFIITHNSLIKNKKSQDINKTKLRSSINIKEQNYKNIGQFKKLETYQDKYFKTTISKKVKLEKENSVTKLKNKLIKK